MISTGSLPTLVPARRSKCAPQFRHSMLRRACSPDCSQPVSSPCHNSRLPTQCSRLLGAGPEASVDPQLPKVLSESCRRRYSSWPAATQLICRSRCKQSRECMPWHQQASPQVQAQTDVRAVGTGITASPGKARWLERGEQLVLDGISPVHPRWVYGSADA